MKIIFKIARAELRTLFYSPIAWVILVTFFVVTGMQFVRPLMELARMQAVEKANNPEWLGFPGPLTYRMFSGTIPGILHYLYLFIPLLTMGAINREVNSGSMNLLSSSPVRIREIVAGKYLGLMIYNLVLMSAVLLLLLTGYFSIEHAEFKWFMSMMLGFWLLSGTYLAIGLFISCLTNYQIMAGIGTFVLFFVLGEMGKLWQQYDLVRDITWFLSMDGRAMSMVRGLITTRDLIYFILIIVLFLGLAVLKLKTKQESVKWTVPFTRNLVWVLMILTVGYFTSRPGYIGYLDVTRDQRNTIDTATQAVLKELDGSPVTVTLYTNLVGPNMNYGLPEGRNKYIWDFWEKYIRFYPNLTFNYVYYYDVKEGDSNVFRANPNKNLQQIVRSYARMIKKDVKDFNSPEEIRKMVDFGNEPLRLMMQLEYKGKKTFLRTFKPNDPWPSEPNVSGAVRKLTRESMPVVTFVTGHFERSPWREGQRDFGIHTNDTYEKPALDNTGVNVDTVSLLHKDIPVNTDVLVVADPRSALSAMEEEKIMQYLNKGGNAIFYAEPGKQAILNPILNQLGVNADNGILVAPRKHAESEIFRSSMTKAGNYMARERQMQIYQRFGKFPAAAVFNGTTNLSYFEKDGFRIEPVVTVAGNEKAWIENGLFVADSAAPVFEMGDGDIRKDEYILALKLSRKINNKEQRIVIAGDADFMSGAENKYNQIGTGMYSWLMYNEYPVYTRLAVPEDMKLTVGKRAGQIIWYVFVYVIPGLLLALGAILIIRRMRK
ncbi:MAG: Gldg family protein [Pseudobacter sp.]|uniref:Gldg family protein n=1 Tax=Pseudobacter sp. TaxID=2045420 RepID=UPI003F814E2D